MKPFRPIAPFALALALALSLSSCSIFGSETLVESAQRELGIPEDCIVISFADDTGADDYGERQQAFYDELEAALQRKEGKILIRNALPLDRMAVYNLDHSVFWLEHIATSELQWAQLAGDAEKTRYQYYEFSYYDLSDQEIEAMKQQIDEAADQILAQVPAEAGDWLTSKVIHDELCRLITYDQSLGKPHTHDLYGALVNHEAVCSAYSIAFHYLMDKAGYHNMTAYSDSHAWNDVSVPSYDTYIDTTWDDTDLTDRNGNPYVFYDYFFLKREEVESIDDHDIASGNPITSSVSETIPYNYHAHEGYLASSYDIGATAEMFARQFATGTNLLTVRFASDEDYQTALAWKEGGEDISTLLLSIGYEDTFYVWDNDNVNTINIGLYPPQ